MSLHPDILTDLVILYHAGEASQASRELLEREAMHDPAVAAALAARPRAMPPLPTAPVFHERETLKRVRLHYISQALIAVSLALTLLAILAVFRSQSRNPGASGFPDRAPQSRPGPGSK
jgi:hypothetical protein